MAVETINQIEARKREIDMSEFRYWTQDAVDAGVIDAVDVMRQENGGVYTTLRLTEVMDVLLVDVDISTIHIDDIRGLMDEVEHESGYKSEDFNTAMSQLEARVESALEDLG